MRAKLTSNQLTLPDTVVAALGHSEYVELELRNGMLFVTPVATPINDDIRRKMEMLGVTEDIVAEAVTWAREHR